MQTSLKLCTLNYVFAHDSTIWTGLNWVHLLQALPEVAHTPAVN